MLDFSWVCLISSADVSAEMAIERELYLVVFTFTTGTCSSISVLDMNKWAKHLASFSASQPLLSPHDDTSFARSDDTLLSEGLDSNTFDYRNMIIHEVSAYE